MNRSTSDPRIVTLIAFSVFVLFTNGCSSSRSPIQTPDVRGDRLAAQAQQTVDQRNYSEALRLFQRARIQYSLVDSRADLARINYNRGSLLHRLTLNNKGLQALNRSYEIYQEQGDTDGRARVLLTRASILQTLGHPSEAHNDLKKISNLNSTLTETPRFTLVEAYVHYRMKNFDESRRKTRHVLNSLRASSDQAERSATRLLMSKIHEQQGNLQASLVDAQKALEIDRKRVDPLSIMKSLQQTGELKLALNRTKKGKNDLKRARRIADQYGLQQQIQRIDNLLDSD